MTVPHTLTAKAGWTRLYHFDWANFSERKSGETILTAAVAVSPSGPTVGTPVIDGDFVQVTIAGGTAGTVYAVTCTVTTSGGATLSQVGYLSVE